MKRLRDKTKGRSH